MSGILEMDSKLKSYTNKLHCIGFTHKRWLIALNLLLIETKVLLMLVLKNNNSVQVVKEMK